MLDPMVDGLEMASAPSLPTHSKNKSLDLRETIIVGKMTPNSTNSVYKIQRQLFARSERVKGIDFHPVEPWILTTLYSGTNNPA
jgi:coatomer subunit beta'